jgi:hypothetical protein
LGVLGAGWERVAWSATLRAWAAMSRAASRWQGPAAFWSVMRAGSAALAAG